MSEETMIDIKQTNVAPRGKGLWDGEVWRQAETGTVSAFNPDSSDHHPLTEFKLLYDEKAIYVHFRVRDRYVVARARHHQDSVCKDSCAEFFVRPLGDRKGYFNVEINCGGTVLLHYVSDWLEKGRRQSQEVSEEWLRQLSIFHTMPDRVEEEITTETVWQIEYRLPYAMFSAYLGETVSPAAGDVWPANFYKCADASSHPHWGMWRDVAPPKNFHQPEKFGRIVFA